MIEISNTDTERILLCLDIAITHYRARPGLRNTGHAWSLYQLKQKITRKLQKKQTNPHPRQKHPHKKHKQHT